MPVPKKRTSKSRRDMRRAHDFISAKPSFHCPNCGNPVLPHHVCLSCGNYKGRTVVTIKDQTQS